MSDQRFIEVLNRDHHCLVRTDLIAFIEREDSGALKIFLQGVPLPIQVAAVNAMVVLERLNLKPETDWTPKQPA